jgi:hypothetical protein
MVSKHKWQTPLPTQPPMACWQRRRMASMARDTAGAPCSRFQK